MSEHNYAGMAFKANLEKDPSLMTIDLEKIEAHQKQVRAQRDAAAPPTSKPELRKEYNALRQQLFNLQQNAKALETRTNESADKIHLLEQRLNEALKLKKEASEAGNLRGERTYERQAETLETELLDAQEEYGKNKIWNAQAARAVREFKFNQNERIAELKAILEAPATK